MIDTQQDVQICRRLRRAVALPIYTIALVLSLLGDALGVLGREDRRRRLAEIAPA